MAIASGIPNGWAQTNRPLAELPPTPPAPTTVGRMNFFRQLITMNPGQREQVLAKRTPQDRQVLEEKVREFENLSPEQREARLQALQRQMDFRVLIRLTSSNRLELLAQMPQADQQWQKERLTQWDHIPPELQSAILTNLPLLRFLFPDDSVLPGRSSLDSRSLSRAQREAMEKAIAEWNRLPEDKREAISNHFCRIFSLDDKQQAQILQPLSPVERRQMERCLQVFSHLPRREQALGVATFDKFARLSPEERQEFLRNAEQWQKMSAQDRQLWRQLVNRLRPPLPPMPPDMLPPMPPLPGTGLRPQPRALPFVAGTNG